MLRRLYSNSRLRAEAGWVLFHKLAEFGLTFLELKLFTIIMGAEVFAEYRLVLAAALLVGHVTVMPMQQAYLRNRTAAKDPRAAGRFAVRWLAAATLSVCLVAALGSVPAARWLGLETWTVLAGGLVFLGNRWRVFWIQLLEFQRRRQATALQNVGFVVTEVVLVLIMLLVWGVSASAALAAYAVAAGAFGLIGVRATLREAGTGAGGSDGGMKKMLVHFGLPFGALMTCQWLLNFTERYILGIQLDLNSVGVYIAAYTVCGFPFMFALAVLKALLVPVAYQRAEGADDAQRLWSADVILVGGIGAYGLLSVLTVPAYLFVGPWLLRAMTSAEFALSGGVMLCLAVARSVQCVGPLLEAFFAVHQRMYRSLGYRLIGGLAVVPICWFSIQWYGVLGAAVGVLIANALFVVLLCVGPGGCFRLAWGARREALAKHHLEAVAAGSGR